MNNSFVAADIYHDNSIVARIPSANGVTSGFAFSPLVTGAGALGCTQNHRMMGANEPEISNNKDSLAITVLNSNSNFSKYNDGLQWEHRNGILNMLKDSVLDNSQPVLAQFAQQQSNTNLGKINTLMRALGNYADVQQNKNLYLQQLNGINTSADVVEQNYLLFMREYLNNVVDVAKVSQSTYSNMQNLAQKCPYSDGAVVYNARAIMKIWGDETVYFNECELPQLTTASEQSKKEILAANDKTEQVLVYPNPNNGSFNIAYEFKQTLHSFELYDLMGRKVTEKTLNGNEGIENITINNMDSGVYFYKVTDVTGKMLFTGKLIINK